jgi:hypothetical protein
MQNVKILLGIGAGLLTAVAVACGSSSSGNPSSPTDAGGDDTTITGDDGNTPPAGCIPLGTTGCAKGQDCCLDLSGGLASITSGGMCVAAGTCAKSNVSVGCEKTADCTGTQVCCADLGGVDGGALAALQDGGLAALGIDAAALTAEAGAGALGGLNLSFSVDCAASCSPMQIQVCMTSAECTGGATCVPLTMLAGDAGGGILGDAGLPAGLSTFGSALGMVGACVPPAGDAGTPVDSGMEDVVVPTDAPTADAPVDSPAE